MLDATSAAQALRLAEVRLLPIFGALGDHGSKATSPPPFVSAYPKETPLFLEFSLCLSRACLGKMMHFIYKWRKKWRFFYRCRQKDPRY